MGRSQQEIRTEDDRAHGEGKVIMGLAQVIAAWLWLRLRAAAKGGTAGSGDQDYILEEYRGRRKG